MAAALKLTDEQMAFLLKRGELLDSLFEMADSETFKAEFGEMSLSEVLERYTLTLSETDESDPVLRERYKRMKSELETGDSQELAARLKESASWWDKELSS